MDSTTTDVIIIGAGPAGLMAALALSKMRVKVQVIDRRLPQETSGQADGIQPRMLEIWESLGMGSELRHRSEHVYRMVTYAPNSDRSGIQATAQLHNMLVPSARYQYEILARIEIIEEILRGRLKAEGVTVDYPSVPISLEVEGDSRNPFPLIVAKLNEKVLRESNVSYEARGDPESVNGLVDKMRCISAKFVIGCDGGKSWTRKQLNIAMEGNQTDLDWGVIDFTPKTNFPTPRTKNIIQSPLAGAVGYLPRPDGGARVYVMLGEGLEERIVSGPESMNIIAEVRIGTKIRLGFAPYQMEIQDASWCTIFRASQRVAAQFSRYGRIFLAGDACHTHSPKAGQGANASMSDTFNLAWKIGYVVRHGANPAILDTYEKERRPHSLELIELDRKIFRFFNGQKFTPEQYTRYEVSRHRVCGGIGLRYSSDLVDASGQSLAPGLSIGERLPSIDIIRVDDWRPLNLHDICPFDGKFRVIILPGDMLNKTSAEGLAKFSDLYATAFERGDALADVLEAHIIINNNTSVFVESLSLPLDLVGGRYDRYVYYIGVSWWHSIIAGFTLAAVVILQESMRDWTYLPTGSHSW
ncbi:FAD binding domain-containing protein [Mycena capillaripes]|nr:FAD binding domain-containing protein [Mycena capillaripes]